jgi:hypothetical protein
MIPGKLKCVVLGLIVALSLVAGCGGRTNLERASNHLKQGMSSSDVRAVFQDFKLLEDVTNSIEVISPTKSFQSRRFAASVMQFDTNQRAPLIGRLPEWCTVYFDTNGVIIAFKYCYMD